MAGLSKTIQDAVLSGFGALDDMAKSITYRQITTQGYADRDEVVAGRTTPGYTDHVLPLGSAVKDEYKESEVDGQTVLPTDVKFLIPGALVTWGRLKPDDMIIDDQGVEWQVIEPGIDPAGALWEVQARRTKKND